MNADSHKVAAIVVAYHPELALLEVQLRQLSEQVHELFVVDNGGCEQLEAVLASTVQTRYSVVRPGKNLGMAGGLNAGIAAASAAGCRYALFLDQDSVPSDGLVASLRSAAQRLHERGVKLAAVGPVIRERATGRRAPFVRFALPFNRHFRGGSGSVRCDFIISSGTFVELAAMAHIGLMDPALFIDNVDLEWCFRARRLGYEVHGVFDAVLDHSIGERRSLLPGNAGPFYRHHSPQRLYYIMRNRLLLYRRGAPRAWVFHDLARIAGKFILFSLASPRAANARAMVRGLIDGVRGCEGEFRWSA